MNVRDSKYSKQERIEAYDSSEKDLTDTEFLDECEIDSDEIDEYIK